MPLSFHRRCLLLIGAVCTVATTACGAPAERSLHTVGSGPDFDLTVFVEELETARQRYAERPSGAASLDAGPVPDDLAFVDAAGESGPLDDGDGLPGETSAASVAVVSVAEPSAEVAEPEDAAVDDYSSQPAD